MMMNAHTLVGLNLPGDEVEVSGGASLTLRSRPSQEGRLGCSGRQRPFGKCLAEVVDVSDARNQIILVVYEAIPITQA